MSKPVVALPIAQPVAKKDKKSSKSPPAAASTSNHNTHNTNTDEIDVTELLSIPHVQCFSLADNKKKHLATGDLKILLSSSKEENKLHNNNHNNNNNSLTVNTQDTDHDHYIIDFPDSVFSLCLKPDIPVLEMAALNFIFPAPNSVSYGLVLPDNIETEKLEIFIILLHQHCHYTRAGIELPITQIETKEDLVIKTASTVSKTINSSTQTVVDTVTSASAKLAIYIAESGTYMKTKLKPNEKPTVISANTKEKLHRAKIVTGAATKVSKALVLGAVATANVLSSQVSSSIAETQFGQKLQANPSPRMNAAKDVAKSTISSIAAITSSLLSNGLVLVSALGSATADVVGHKYGEETGAVANEAAQVVKNVATSVVDMRQVGVKAILAKTATTTVVDVLSTDEEKKEMKKISGNPSLAIDPLIALQVLHSVNQVQSLLQDNYKITEKTTTGSDPFSVD